MEERSIAEAAEAAIKALQVGCEVGSVSRPSGKLGWCIQFTDGYAQFCDHFRDEFGNDDSFLLRREKVKHHLLQCQEKMRRKLNSRRKGPRLTGEDYMAKRKQERSTLDTASKVASELFDTATRAVSSVVERVTGAAGTARDTAASATSVVSPTAARAMRPAAGGGGSRTASRPSAERVVESGMRPAREAVSQATKAASRTTRSAAKATNRAAGRAASSATKAVRAGSSSSSGKKAGKKSDKKSGKKSAGTTAKKGTKSSSGAKKSARKK